MVTQPTGMSVVGGSNPILPTLPPPPAALKFSKLGFDPTPGNPVSAALPLDHWACYQRRSSPLLVAY